MTLDVSSRLSQPTFGDVFRGMSKRGWAITGVIAGLVISAVALTLLFATGLIAPNVSGLVRLDAANVALRVQTELESQGITATVECPPSLVAPKNFSFKCGANTPEGAFAALTVTIVNELGDINWYLNSDLPLNAGGSQ